jgi:FixJ family two-component response regulator/signal transduction histidine kinase
MRREPKDRAGYGKSLVNDSGHVYGAREAERAKPDAAQLEQLAFERLLGEISVRFANVSYDGIVAEIERALGELVQRLGYDRCTYTEIAPDAPASVVCSAAVGSIGPWPRGAVDLQLPWLIGELQAGRVVALSDLPEGLPAEATAERAHVARTGLRSHLSIPLRVGGRVAGALSFAGVHSAREWSAGLINRLTIIGEVLASAAARVRSEEEARRIRNRLWHADRVSLSASLTAAIAHELNQPLAAILSNAQAGLRYLDRGMMKPEDVRAILESIVRDDKRAAETIRTMRALLRQDESGRTRIDAAAAVQEVLRLLAGELDDQGIRVDAQFGAECWVAAEKAQLQQVALNLILNAAASMQSRPRDERRLRVSVLRTEDGRVAGAVRDSGTGIAPEHLEAVFEPFFTTKAEGLGLGLAICRMIAQAHGGALWAEPNPDGGATFRFELPLDATPAADEPAAAALETTAAAQPVAAGDPIVCVLDDDPGVRESLLRLLAAAGWSVECYASAGEFLERRSTQNVACLVLDVRMPGLPGPELQQLLVARGVAPPLVFLTASDDLAAGVDAMKLGAVDFLTKPVDGEILVAAVRKAIERHAGERTRNHALASSKALVGRLSVREHEVVAHVLRGRLNKQIAADLDIAEQTVKQHRSRAMEKLGVRSVAELVRVCESSGLFADPEIPPPGTRAT